MDIVFSPVAQTVSDVAASRFQRIGHNLEAVEGDLGSSHTSQMVAVVVFQEINAPIGEVLSIFSFMIK